jgi:hypothetical protein
VTVFKRFTAIQNFIILYGKALMLLYLTNFHNLLVNTIDIKSEVQDGKIFNGIMFILSFMKICQLMIILTFVFESRNRQTKTASCYYSSEEGPSLIWNATNRYCSSNTA